MMVGYLLGDFSFLSWDQQISILRNLPQVD